MRYWLLKTEPSTFSWDDLVRDGSTSWTGVRNYQARNNLRAMAVGDRAFIYHSVEGKAVVGTAVVSKAAHPDPTATEGDWSTVEVKPDRAAERPVTLDEIKANAALREMVLVNNSRLSVQPVTAGEWKAVCALLGLR